MSQTSTPTDSPPLVEAFGDPEKFVSRWHTQPAPYSPLVFVGLALIAIAGTIIYGLLLGLGKGPERMIESGLLACLASAISWATPLPAIYILNSMAGMRLRASTTFLAALVTAAWGGCALIAFMPISLVYLLTFPNNRVALIAHGIVFAFVGFTMASIFSRQLECLEKGQGGGRVWWLWLFVCLKVQLLYSFGLISFSW